jgi:hypothetical protein
MCLLDNQNHSQEVLENDDFLEVSSARRLVNISGTVTLIDLNFSQVKYMGLLHMHMPTAYVYCSATTTIVPEAGTK